MSLTGAIQIGRSALTASQIGIQVASNNMANVATPGYSRQSARLDAIRGTRQSLSVFVGRGVSVGAIQRQVDEGLRSRLDGAIADQSAARTMADLYATIEATLNELGEGDLSSELNEFFNAWSERANLTESSAVVIQRGQQLAGVLNRLHADLSRTRDGIDADLSIAVEEANRLVRGVAELNGQIVSTEVGTAVANDLRDQRDRLVEELSELIDVTSVSQAGGGVDLLVGSSPLVLGATPRGLALRRVSSEAGVEVSIVAGENQRELRITSGRIGALLDARESAVGGTLDDLDRLAGELIFQVNRLHATGANREGLRSATSTMAFDAQSRDMAINDPDNPAFRDAPRRASNGGLFVHVRHEATGATTIARIAIDLDGIADDLTGGTGDDTSVADLVASLDGVRGLSASFDAGGRVRIEGEDGFTFEFSDDTSDVLAVLGINSYFTGEDASNIAINAELEREPGRLRVGRLVNGELIENATALAIASLQDSAQIGLAGESFRGFWLGGVQRVAGEASSALSRDGASTIIRESLEAQRASVSGVSLDEESIDLLNFQRQYQGAARVISIADELLQTLIAIV